MAEGQGITSVELMATIADRVRYRTMRFILNSQVNIVHGALAFVFRYLVSRTALAVLCLTVGSAVLIPLSANASTELIGVLQSDGTTLYQGNPSGNIGTGTAYCFGYYLENLEYPATSSYPGGLDCSWYTDPWEDFVNNLGVTYIQTATTSGTYWLNISQGPSLDTPYGSVTDYYIPFTITSTGEYYQGYASTTDSYTGLENSTITKLTDASLATGTASTSINFDIDYFIDTNEITADNRPDMITVSITTSNNSQFDQKDKLIVPLSDGSSSTNIVMNESYPDGNYTANIFFQNINSGLPTFSWSTIVLNFTVSGDIVTVASVVEQDSGIYPGSKFIPDTCGITALGGCITNSMRYLFVPSADSFQSITALQTNFANRAPFAYFYDIPSVYGALFDTTQSTALSVTASTSIGDITFISASTLTAVPLASTIRLILGYLIWIMFAFSVYRQVLVMFNKPASV